MQDEVTVTQADIDAWEIFGPKIFHCEMTGSEALARHRHQAERETLARMEPVAWMYYAEDGQEATTPLKNRLSRNAVERMDWTETPLYALPPAPEAGQ